MLNDSSELRSLAAIKNGVAEIALVLINPTATARIAPNRPIVTVLFISVSTVTLDLCIVEFFLNK
jgi:hypothetical protein